MCGPEHDGHLKIATGMAISNRIYHTCPPPRVHADVIQLSALWGPCLRALVGKAKFVSVSIIAFCGFKIEVFQVVAKGHDTVFSCSINETTLPTSESTEPSLFP